MMVDGVCSDVDGDDDGGDDDMWSVVHGFYSTLWSPFAVMRCDVMIVMVMLKMMMLVRMMMSRTKLMLTLIMVIMFWFLHALHLTLPWLWYSHLVMGMLSRHSWFPVPMFWLCTIAMVFSFGASLLKRKNHARVIDHIYHDYTSVHIKYIGIIL